MRTPTTARNSDSKNKLMGILSEEKKQEYLSWFDREAQVEHEGKVYRLDDTEFQDLVSYDSDWHFKGDPSSWLVVRVVNSLKYKYGKELGREKTIAWAAALFQLPVEKIESTLDWNANYMAWHEGGTPEEFHAWMKFEN